MGCRWRRGIAASCGKSLLGKAGKRASFKEALLAYAQRLMNPDFERLPQVDRPIEL